tara:strand:+ start:75 stop:413 length:339 start_codon:yes stop_codon:yes gene_type:complete
MAFYESIVITRPELTSNQVESLSKSLEEILENNSAKVKKHEYWGLRSLAYKINKNKKGHYSMLNIDGETSAIKEFERQMKLNQDIIRFLTIKINNINEEPSILSLNKENVND